MNNDFINIDENKLKYYVNNVKINIGAILKKENKKK
jgi:hypothetical protein